MRTERQARAFFGATAAIVGAGLVLQLVLSLTADDESSRFATSAGRVVNFLSFFTVLSNITVAVTSAMLARDLRRPSTSFCVLRVAGVIGIAVTGVVFHLALADLNELTGWDWLADRLLHLLGPILAPLGWVVFGPRRQIDARIAGLSALPPVAWLTYTLIRGATVEDRFGNGYYPYPFLNVDEHGYTVVLTNAAIVAVLFAALAAAMVWLDRTLDERGVGLRSADEPSTAVSIV